MPRRSHMYFGQYTRKAIVGLPTVNNLQSEESSEDDNSSDDDIQFEEMDVNNHDSDSSVMEHEQIGVAHQESELNLLLRKIPTPVLSFLTAACISRFSERDFQRFLSCHSANFRQDALRVWNFKKGMYSTLHVCNSCGKSVRNSETCECGGKILKVTRVGAFSQLVDLVQEHSSKILKLREELRSGRDKSHNLNSEFLKKNWIEESAGLLHLTLLASVDGVSLKGNSKKKIWPVTLKLADLPIAEMQKSVNILLEAIVEGVENPSTVLWNHLIPIVFMDMENKVGEVDNIKFKASIVTFTADQPAKRSLFGMAASNSEMSCFYGLCPGTLYKTRGPERYTSRKGILTQQDSLNAQNGFKNVPSFIVNRILPYDTIVDVLHNLPEGILEVIMNEMTSQRKAKSELFADITMSTTRFTKQVKCHPFYKKMERKRNATEKMNFFRIHIGMTALVNEEISAKARLVLVALMLICNFMYSDSPIASGFLFHLTDITKRILSEASEKYLSIKTHELLEHLPYVYWKFGNPAPLSTFSYESFYKFCLSGFNPQLTNNFTETAASRVQLHVSLRREVRRRAVCQPDVDLEAFLKETPDLRHFKTSWSHKLTTLTQEENEEVNGAEAYGTLQLSYGKLISTYSKSNSTSDHFFSADVNGQYTCHRFVCAIVKDGKLSNILTEPISESPRSLQFIGLQKLENEMKGTQFETSAAHLLTHARVYPGLIHGRLSEKRATVPFQQLRGFAAQLEAHNGTYYLQINGCAVHN
ncbi:hypothetical protein CAEBREN_23434 [Caenorhabditis brenneri]|uniref:Uncharacterized protein n=1 Tax=Caenorhabditis brenneri TaxID=135651 RepID=G0N1B8_CAEBE|nr:hypothetical protein CAEBREN_23434 [Caenorhabditis brenneri]